MKDKEKQIENMCNDIIRMQNQKRTEYCLRIQKAFEYKGTNDHEDIPSILKDYEDLIMNRYYMDSVVLSCEEYEKLRKEKNDYKQRFESSEKRYEQLIQSSCESLEKKGKGTAEKIIKLVDNKLDLYRHGVIGGSLYDDGYKSAIQEIKYSISKQFGVEIKE